MKQQWEYLVMVIDYGGSRLKLASVYILQSDGTWTTYKKQQRGDPEGRLLSHLLNELGNNGWELTGIDSSYTPAVHFFKRPKV